MGVQLTAESMCELLASCAYRGFRFLGEIRLFIFWHINMNGPRGSCKNTLKHSHLERLSSSWFDSDVIDSNCSNYLRTAIFAHSTGVAPRGSQNSKCQDWNYRRTRFCIVSGLSYVVDILSYTEIEPWSTWCRHQMETFSALLAICEGIHRSSVHSSHKDQWRGALMFSLVWARTNG